MGSLHGFPDVIARVEQHAVASRKLAAQFETHLESLRAKLSKRRSDVENRRLEARQWDEAMEDVLRGVATLTKRRQVLEERRLANQERAAVVGSMCIQKQELLERHTRAAQVCASLKKIMPSLERSLDLFAKKAGLRLILVPERGCRICLTLLDSRQPHRCCSLLLGIDSEGRYIVSECSPALPNLDALVDQLRKTRELGHFVRSLRRHFKSLLLAQPTECVATQAGSCTPAQVAS